MGLSEDDEDDYVIDHFELRAPGRKPFILKKFKYQPKYHMNDLTYIDFKTLAYQQKSVQMKMRLLALALFQERYTRTQIAKRLNVSRTSVNKWVKTYLTEGLDGLQEKPRSGRPALLSSSQEKLLSQYIEQNTSKPAEKRLTRSDVHLYIKQEFNVDCHPDYVYTILKRLGFAWVTSRSSHTK